MRRRLGRGNFFEGGAIINKTAIEWADFTWNPCTGCWGPGGTAERPQRCAYCYANRIAKRDLMRGGLADPFVPAFHFDRLSQPAQVKKPSKIFVCSMADLFGDWVPEVWILRILVEVVRCCPWHTFMFLTKNPKRLKEFRFYPNCWVGTTVTNQADADERLPWLLQVEAPMRFVSHEPLLSDIDLQYPTSLYPDGPQMCCSGEECACQGAPIDPPLIWGINWAIIGGMTGPGAIKPEPEWVQGLIDQYRAAGVPVFCKDNLGLAQQVREWPR